MKHLLSLFIIICILSHSAFNAQDINKMNKSNLKEHILGLSTQIDSLKDVNYMLEESKDSLLLNVSLLGSANEVNEIEISRLSNLVVINNQEIERLQSDYDNEITNLNETILEYQASYINSQDSIVQIQKALLDCQVSFLNSQDSVVNNQDTIVKLQNAILNCQNSIVQLQESVLNFEDLIVQLQDSLSNSQTTITPSNDFLNKYYFDQIPLPNNSFQLVLSKIIIGNKHISKDNDDYYSNDNYKNSVHYLPETLDGNAFAYWGVAPNVMLTDNSEFNDYLINKDKDYFDSNLPQIEILKNKLFTIIYHDDTEESFLFNVNESDPNNHRKTLQIDLANEGVDNNTANDIVWRMFAIENECYLALTHGQLNRLKLYLYSYSDGIETSRSDNSRISLTRDFTSYYNRKTTGNGMYLSRNKDVYMNTSKYIKPEKLIFLLKLKEI